MKVRFHGESDPLTFLDGKEYEVLSIEEGWYRIVDETGDDYLYAPNAFEVTDASEPAGKNTKHLCPICGKYEFPDENSFCVCPVCNLEDDCNGLQVPKTGETHSIGKLMH